MSRTIRYALLVGLITLAIAFVLMTVHTAASSSQQNNIPLTLPGFSDREKTIISGSPQWISDTVSNDLAIAPETQQPFSIQATPNQTVTLAAWWNIRPTENYLRDVSMLSPDYTVDCGTKVGQSTKSKGWIVGDNGVILGYCNGVWSTFIPVESVPTNLNAVQALEPSLAVAVGAAGTILEYKFDPVVNGDAWTKYPIPVATQAFYDVSMVPDGAGGYIGWAVGEKDTLGHGILAQGRIPHLPNTPWLNRTNDFPLLPQVDYYNDVQTISPTDAWAVGGVRGVKGIIIHWDGNQWTLDQQIGTDVIHAIYMRSASEGWAVGRDGKIYKYDGNNWSIHSTPTTNKLMDIKFDQDGVGWAVGDKFTILRYQNNQWSAFTERRNDPWWLIALDFNSGHGWMVALNDIKKIGGHILEYTDGLWLPYTIPTDNRLNDVAVVDENDVWAVGHYDSEGGTIVHWDGLHWQRWYQKDLPIPSANLYAIDMVSPTLGWAAGDPLGGPAVFLRWDGVRWAQPREVSPVNVRVNDLSMLKENINPYLRAWGAASNGNAVPRWDGVNHYWTAISTCYGFYYDLRGVSVFPSSTAPTGFNWDAWAVGKNLTVVPNTEHILQFTNNCPDGNRWREQPALPATTSLYGIDLLPQNTAGYAVGLYNNKGVIYAYNSPSWSKYADNLLPPHGNSSILRSVDIIDGSGIGWFGGYYYDTITKTQNAMIYYRDANGLKWAGMPWPTPNIYSDAYHRPIMGLEMASDTLGWAVGDGVDTRNLSVIYHYPLPNYTIDVDPFSQAVAPGSSATYTVTVISRNEIGPDAPYEVINSWSQYISATVNSDTILLETSLNTPPGKYDFKVKSTSSIWSLNKFVPISRYDTFQLIVNPVLVTTIAPSKARAGEEVVINGFNFGSDPGAGNRSTPSHNVVLAGRQMPDTSVVFWSDNEIRVIVPDNPTLFPLGPDWGPVSVTANSITSNAQLTFQLQNYLSGVTNHINGSFLEVTVYGTSLGNDPGSSNRSTQYEHVTFNGAQIPNSDVLSWNNNAIKFRIVAGPWSGSITVTSNGYQSNSLDLSEGWSKVYVPLVIR